MREGPEHPNLLVIVGFAGAYGHFRHVRADLTYAWGGEGVIV